MLHNQNSSQIQICETVDQIIDYFLVNPDYCKTFVTLSPPEKSKQFSELLKNIKSSPKNYKLKIFVQDLAFLVQSFTNVDSILNISSDLQLIPYIISSLFYEISEFKSIPGEKESKEKLNFSFTQKTKLSNYLIFLLNLISEDQELLDVLTNTYAYDIIESLRKILQSLMEISEKFDISDVFKNISDIIGWIIKVFKTFLCEKNLVIVNKLIKNQIMEKYFNFFSYELTAKSSLDILILLIKYGSVDLNFQEFMNEKKVLKNLAGINKNIEFLISFLDLNFYFEFSSFSQSDLFEIQKHIKQNLKFLPEEKGQEFIHRIYQLSFSDFNLLDSNLEKRKNPIFGIQKEHNENKYIRQNFIEKIVITPSFIEILVSYYEELCRSNLESFLKFEILHKILEMFDTSHKNFFIIESEFKMIRRLIESLLMIDSETSHILLKIIHYVITIIVPEDELNRLSEEFIHLSVVLSKCKDLEVLLQIFDLLRDFLSLNKKKFQIFLKETEVYSGILSHFLTFFKENKNEYNYFKEKYQKISELLKLLLRNNEENLKIFLNFDLFNLMIRKLSMNDKNFNDLIIFFLEEQAKIANLESFLVTLINTYKEHKNINEKIQISEIFFLLLTQKTEVIEIFRDAILKKYSFLHNYVELISDIDINNEFSEETLHDYLKKLKKYLISDNFLRNYYRKKNLIMFMFKKMKNLLENKQNLHKIFIAGLFNLAIKDAIFSDKDRSENNLNENTHFIKISKKDEIIVIFPEIFNFMIMYLSKIIDLPIQMHILEELKFILKSNQLNAKIIGQTNFLETLGIVYYKEIKTSIHPFYESLLQIIYRIVSIAPKFQDIKLLENILLAINQEISDSSQQRNANFQDKFIKKTNRLINKKCFYPNYLEFRTKFENFLFIKNLWFPHISDNLITSISETKSKNRGFTYSLWIKSNYHITNMNKFHIFHLSVQDEKSSVILFLEKCHLYLKFMENEPIQLTNILFNDEQWYELTLCFTIQGSNLTEFELFLNGISFETRILNSIIGLESEIFNYHSQILIGFDQNYTNNNANDDYFFIGPIRLFSKPLTAFEINLLYCISNSFGIVNYFSEAHSINWPMVSFSNLRFFEISQNRKDIKGYVSFTKPQIYSRIAHLTQFLVIECDPGCNFSTKNKDVFIDNLKNHFKPSSPSFSNSMFLTFLLNKANDNLNSQGYLMGQNNKEMIIYKDFWKKNILFSNNIVNVLEKSNFVFTIFELLEKTENRAFFLQINQILMDFIEKSEFFAERFESDNLFKVYFVILKKRNDFFQKDMIMNFMPLFCKRVNFLNKNSLSSSATSHSSQNSYYWLIVSMKIGKEILMDLEFYQIFLSKLSIRIEFFDIMLLTLIDPNKNLFSNFNKHALRNSEFINCLLDLLLMESNNTFDSKIFEIISIIIKQTNYLEFDQENFKKICEFTLLSFFSSYKKIEHLSKATKRKHLESIDALDNKLTSNRKLSNTELFESSFTTRNSKKIAFSATFTNQTNQTALQINSSLFHQIHKFESAVNLKRFDILQGKFLDFLIKTYEFPHCFIPVKTILHILQAKAFNQISSYDQKNISNSLCKLLGLAIINTDNKKTLVAYEDLHNVLKPYCNDSWFYSYIFLSITRKIKYDTNELESPLQKDEKLPNTYLKVEDIGLLTHLIALANNSLKNLKNILSNIQNDEYLLEISQIFNRSSSEKRDSLMPAQQSFNSFLTTNNENYAKPDEIQEGDEEALNQSPGFMKISDKRNPSSAEELKKDDISFNDADGNKVDSFLKNIHQKNEELSLENQLDEKKIDENLFKDSPNNDNNTPPNPLMKIFNISPVRVNTLSQKNPIIKSRTPSAYPANKKKVNIKESFQADLDMNTQLRFKQKMIDILINENVLKSQTAVLMKNLVKFFNENENQDEYLGYLSIPNYELTTKYLEKIMKYLMNNKSLISRKLSENLLVSLINILQTYVDIKNFIFLENLPNSPDFLSFIGFCLAEILTNEVSLENDSNFQSFSRFSRILADNFSNEKFIEILRTVLEIIVEKIDEGNLLEYSKMLKKTYNFIFSKIANLPYDIIESWFGNNILAMLKKFFYFNKTLKDTKNTSTFKSFFNKMGFGGGDKSPMVKSEFFDKMNKKDKNLISEFKGEIQSLLRKNILFEINRNIEIFESNNEEEPIVEKLKEYEENEKIIFDEEFENTEFYQCLLSLFGRMLESKNKNICSESILFLSYLPYHISKEAFKKMFINNECNLYDKCFDMLYSIKNNHSEESSKRTKSPLDFYILLNSVENKKKFEILIQKKYLNVWVSFVNTQLKPFFPVLSDVLKPKEKISNDFTSSFIEIPADEKKLQIHQTGQKEVFVDKVKRTKTLSEKPKEALTIKLTEVSDIDKFLPIDKNTSSNPFMPYYISVLDKNIKELLMRKLLQKLDSENQNRSYNNYLNARLYSYFYENNPYILEKALRSQKKELKFTLNNKIGLFMQRSLVFNKISLNRNEDEEGCSDFEMSLSPTKRHSILKKSSGIDFLKTFDGFQNRIIPEDPENQAENNNNNENNENKNDQSENEEDMHSENKEEFMLDTEIDVEETEDYVYVFNEYEGNSKAYKENLMKLKKILTTSETIESFYPITYLKKFGFIIGLLVICKRNVYIMRNWSYDEKQGIYDINEITTNQFQEKDKSLLITKGTNIQPITNIRKTTFMDESIINENPLELTLNRSGICVSSEMEIGGGGNFSFQLRRKYDHIKIPIEKIVEINSKRYLLAHCAIEINTTQKSFFIIVGKEKREKIFDDLKKLFPSKITKNQLSKENFLFTMFYKANPFLFENENPNYQSYQTLDVPNLIKIALPLWQEGILNNFEYLMFLNVISGRTYNDLAQYPVFPWILKNFSDGYEEINLNNPEQYRDLSKPIGALNIERAKNAKENYFENPETAPFNYGSHYSNPGIVNYYLLRLMPFGQLAIDLQGGKFDFSDRLFFGIKECWETVEQADYKELIPEFFYLPEFLLNLNKFNFGVTSFSHKVNDVILPKWALSNPRYFVMFHRKALESIPVSLALNEWIDLIFGFKQMGKAAIEALNVFYILTYEGTIDLQKIENMQEKNGILDQINEFGQTPRQLFLKPHLLRKKMEKSESLFYDPFYLKSLTCIKIMSAPLESLSFQKPLIYQDFYIDKEIFGLNLERIAGLSSCIKIKPGKMTKEDLINIRIIKEGSCLLGNTSKTLNFVNCYNQVILTEEKIERREVLDVFSMHSNLNDGNLIFSSRSKKWLIIGTKLGLIYVYKIIKKKENIKSEITSSCHFHRNSGSSIDTFDERKKQRSGRISFKFSAIKRESDIYNKGEKSSDIKTPNNDVGEILLDEKLKCYFPVKRISLNLEKEKNIAFLNRKEVISELETNFQGKNSSLFKKNKTIKSEGQRKFANITVNSDSKILIEFVSLLKSHNQSISCIKLYEVLLLLISTDEEGIVCLWNLEKGSLNIKIFSYHFLDYDIFKEICFQQSTEYIEAHNKKPNYNKFLSKRERIFDLSICDENGDFCFISNNYVSIYTINAVLISIINRKKEKLRKFSSCLLTQNKTRYEDDYLITGHEDGKIIFWIIKPNQTIPVNQLMTSSNIYLHNYSKKYQFDTNIIPLLIPYKLEIIHLAKTPLRIRNSDNDIINLDECESNPKGFNKNINLRQINKIYLSSDQKKLYSLTINGELYQWNYPDYDDKKCATCGNYFGVFDKKQCGSCLAPLCSSCYQKYETCVPTKDLRKNEKVCEKCYQKIYLKKNCALYDNY